MRLLSVFLSLMLFLQMTCWLPASDAAATYDATNGVKAEGVPVNKIGALLLADAVAFLNNDTIQVNSSTNNNQNLLSGKISDVTVSGSGASATVHGTCVFDSGSRLSEVCPKGKSGCKFKFAMPMSGSKITFTHVSEPAVAKTHTTSSSSPHIEASTTKKIVVTALVLCVIATAIAVPIAVACGTKKRGNRNRDAQQALLLTQLINSRRAAPEPQVLRAVPSGPALPEPNLIPTFSGP